MTTEKTYDIAIIGGGINGCGIARDAAGRGLSVLLAEKDDLANGTSSSSTKLIHGGLRYLEMYAFTMVREALLEREVLLRAAPHIIWPLRFVLPHHPKLRPAWLIRLGLFLYDHLGGRRHLDKSHSIDLAIDPAGAPLRDKFRRGFSYSDCWVDDARLVVLNARDAADHGADILVRWEVVDAQSTDDHWSLDLTNTLTGQQKACTARVLINAAGPWAGNVTSKILGIAPNAGLRHVKGSHIVVAKLFDHDTAYIFQNDDQRVIFAIPYEDDFTLIGTTDVDFTGDLDNIEISADETSYLCEAASEYFKNPLDPHDVLWAFSGVRPLYFEKGVSAQATTRDFVIERHARGKNATLINIFGGKITSYRHLAETTLAQLSDVFPNHTDKWTALKPLPGGDFPIGGAPALARELNQRCPPLSPSECTRIIRRYGTIALDIFAHTDTRNDPGEHFGGGLYAREVEYLVTHEWAKTTQDILWRRTKLGLRLTKPQVERLSSWLQNFCTHNCT